MPISESNKSDSLDRSESVICNGAATDENTNYKARVGSDNRLWVDGESSFIGRSILNIQEVELSQSFQDLLNLTGAGELFGFKVKVSNDAVRVRLEIDGIECFDFKIADLRFCNFANYNNTGLNRVFGTQQYGELDFYPSKPWKWKSSIKIQIRKEVSWSIKREYYVVTYAI